IEPSDAVEYNLHRVPPLLRHEATIAITAPVRRDLCQDTDPRARSNNPVTPETPAPYTCNGLARTSVCRRHRTAPPILISQRSDLARSQVRYTWCTTGSSSGRPDRPGAGTPFGWV